MTNNSKIVKVISIVMLLFLFTIIAFGCNGVREGISTVNEGSHTCVTTVVNDMDPWNISLQKRITPPIVESTSYVTTTTSTQTTSVTTTPVTTLSESATSSTTSGVETKETPESVPVCETVIETEPYVPSPEYVEPIENANPEPPVEEVIPEPQPEVVEDTQPPAVVEEAIPEMVPGLISDEVWYYPELIVYGAHGDYFSYDNQSILKSLCDQYGVDYELMLAIISKESGYTQYANSCCGAMGYCQVMWVTIQQFNWDTGIYYDDYYDAYANMHVGVYIMSLCMQKFGNMYDACAAYTNGLYGHSAGCYSGYAESVISLRDQILALK